MTCVARGKILAVFDADFVPPTDFLKRTVPYFLEKSEIAFIQTRWDHLNREENVLTRCLSLGIDGHFFLERPARFISGLMMILTGQRAIGGAGLPRRRGTGPDGLSLRIWTCPPAPNSPAVSLIISRIFLSLASFRDAVYSIINHKDMSGIYPPLTQFIFAGLSRVTSSLKGYRGFLISIEIGAVLIMMKWLSLLGLAREKILCYSLNPLVIVGIAGRGHLESLQILFLILALSMFAGERRRKALMAVTLAGLVKFLAFFALPFFLNCRTVKHLPLILGFVLASNIPFIFMRGGPALGNMEVNIGEFEYYSLTFLLLRALFGTSGALTDPAAT